MTDRLRSVLDDVAGEMPRPHVSGETWTRARLVRRWRRAAAAGAGTVAAALVVLTTLGALPPLDPPSPPAAAGTPARGLALPATLEFPLAHTPTVTDSAPGPVAIAVKGSLLERSLFRRVRTWTSLPGGGRTERVGQLVVGADQTYRRLEDASIDGSAATAPLLSPDGRGVAAPIARRDVGDQQVTNWSIADTTSGHWVTEVVCAGEGGWTRDGLFACIHRPVKGVSTIKVMGRDERTSTSSWRLRKITDGHEMPRPGLVDSSRRLQLTTSADRRVVDVVDPSGRVAHRVRVAGAGVVYSAAWCAHDLILAVSDYKEAVAVRLGVSVRQRVALPEGWEPIGCRADGAMVIGRGAAGTIITGIRLIDARGRVTGETTLPFEHYSGDGNLLWITSVAVDALNWRVVDAPARTSGTRLEWADEALLVVLLGGAVAGVALLRRRRASG